MMMFSRTVSSMSSVSCCGTTPSRPRIFTPSLAGSMPEDAQRSVGDGRDAADHAHRRRLPRAVRAEEAERLAALEVEVDAVHGDEVAEALDEIACLDQRLTVVARHPIYASYRATAYEPRFVASTSAAICATSAASLSNTASSRSRSHSSTTRRFP